jgi:hypothetical protein
MSVILASPVWNTDNSLYASRYRRTWQASLDAAFEVWCLLPHRILMVRVHVPDNSLFDSLILGL